MKPARTLLLLALSAVMILGLTPLFSSRLKSDIWILTAFPSEIIRSLSNPPG